MNVLIVFAHPEPASFNGALRDTAASSLRNEGHSVEVSDLYGENFDPVEKAAHYARRHDPHHFVPLDEQRSAGRTGTLPASVRREIDRLERADLVIFQFPLWWHAQPAILKGWFDRVLVNGLLYSGARRYDRGVFKGKRAILYVTAGAPERSFGRGGRGGDIEKLLWPIHYSLHYMGFSVLRPFLSFAVAGHGYRYEEDADKQARLEVHRQSWGQRVARLLREQPICFQNWDDWDESGALKPGRDPDLGMRFLDHRSEPSQGSVAV